MKAVVVTAYGEPDVLQTRDLPQPELGPGEVLIRPSHISVNFADLKARRGSHHIKRELPFVPGLDVAGEIIDIGPNVKHLSRGMLVAAATDGGAYAEVVRAREILTFPLPDGADAEPAAGIVTMMTAYNTLVKLGGLQRGETVLVHASAGGVGSLQLQLARLYGAKTVIGVVGRVEKRTVAESFGAHTVIDASSEDVAERVRAETGGRGADVILDSVSGPMFDVNLRILAPFGRIVAFGEASGDAGMVTTDALHATNRTVIGYSSGHYRKHRPEGVREATEIMLRHLARNEIRVAVTATFSLEQAAEAHRQIESRVTTGKLVLKP